VGVGGREGGREGGKARRRRTRREDHTTQPQQYNVRERVREM